MTEPETPAAQVDPLDAIVLDPVTSPFSIVSQRNGSTLTLRVIGDLDMATQSRALAQLDQAGDDVDEIVFDLVDCTFVSSSGVSVLLTARERVSRRQGQVVLASPPATFVRVLEVCGLGDSFAVRS